MTERVRVSRESCVCGGVGGFLVNGKWEACALCLEWDKAMYGAAYVRAGRVVDPTLLTPSPLCGDESEQLPD